MKRIFLIFATVTMALMAGCSYDDGELWETINQLKEEQEQMQQQLDTQQVLLNALANNLTITSVQESEEGYIITFSDGSTITVHHGSDGADGADGTQGNKGDKGDKGDPGDSIIESIIIASDSVTFELTDGRVITIPLGSAGGEVAESNKIYYTTTDGKKIFPNSSLPSHFGAILISNTYADGQGVMIFDDAVTSMAEFDDCKTLKTITIPESVSTIAYETFSGCTSLESIVIPDGVTTMGNYAFEGCESLSSVVIGSGLSSIGGSAFRNCTSLKSVTFGANIAAIGGYAFNGCTSLTTIVIPEGVASIDTYAFRGCSKLASVTIPKSVVEIGEYAFYECNALNAVYISDIAAWCNIAFENNSANPLYCARELRLNGSPVAELVIPESVEAIGTRVFYNCESLTSVTLPQGLASIGVGAFYNCKNLASVFCKAVNPPAGSASMFTNNAANRKIYVPMGSEEAYQGASYWSDLATAIEGYNF